MHKHCKKIIKTIIGGLSKEAIMIKKLMLALVIGSIVPAPVFCMDQCTKVLQKLKCPGVNFLFAATGATISLAGYRLGTFKPLRFMKLVTPFMGLSATMALHFLADQPTRYAYIKRENGIKIRVSGEQYVNIAATLVPHLVAGYIGYQM